MTQPTLEQLVREIIPLLGTTWVDNYEAKRDWINQAQAALETAPPTPTAKEIVWPKSPLRCHCEDFEEDPDDLFSCLHCGGGRF